MILDCTKSPTPIFILGIMPRCGTNFLQNLICLHPDCVSSALWEDFMLYPAPLLEAYAHAVYTEWLPLSTKKLENIMDSPLDSLLHHLGEGLLSFLYTQQPQSQRLVTKTPWVRNLPSFFKLFPNAQLLILIRDGRSVIESGVTSFNWDYQSAMHQWAEAAQKIIQFQQHQHHSHQYMIVKYEDIYSKTVETMTKILEFLNLDKQSYDFAKSINAPVIGSSDIICRGRENEPQEFTIHWQPIEKTTEFNPLSRWHNWDDAKHALFNKISGKQMLQFGYSLQGSLVEEIDSKTHSSTDIVTKTNSPLQHPEDPNYYRQIIRHLLEEYQSVTDNTTKDNFYY
ncbi:MAG: sulfotransferase [Rhizonema sp. PD37]|nr:sulfotransferase [Rhizonema sp. PD37]